MRALFQLAYSGIVAACLLLLGAAGETKVVRLRDYVELRAGVVRLSDLLPPGAALDLQRSCGAIELGASPQPESLRQFQGSMVERIVAMNRTLSGRLEVPERIIVRRTGWTIPVVAMRDAIAQALAGAARNVDLSESLFEWPGEIVASREDPPLRVVRTHWDPTRNATQFRVQCVPKDVCASFLVRLKPPETANANQLAGLSRDADRAVTNSLSPPSTASTDRTQTLVRSGQKAELRLEANGIRISLPVICLRRGRLAEQVPVLEATSHRVLQAEVVASGQLQSKF